MKLKFFKRSAEKFISRIDPEREAQNVSMIFKLLIQHGKMNF